MSFSGAMDPDKIIGSIMESWLTRDVDEDQCRFCNKQLPEPKDPVARYCDKECREQWEKVQEARLAIGRRDLERRGFD